MIDEASMQSFYAGIVHELNGQYGKAMFYYDTAFHQDRSNYYAKYRRLMVEYYKNTNCVSNNKWVRNEKFLTYVALRKQHEQFICELGLPEVPLFIRTYLDDDGHLGFDNDSIVGTHNQTMNNWFIGGIISVIQDAMELLFDNVAWEQKYLAIIGKRYASTPMRDRRKKKSEQRAMELWEQQKRIRTEWEDQQERKHKRVQEGLMDERVKIGTLVIKQNEGVGVLEAPISDGPIDIDPSLDKELKNRGWGSRD